MESLTNRAARLLKHCDVELTVLDECHHLFDVDRAEIMTKAAHWLKVLIVNTACRWSSAACRRPSTC